MNADRSEKKMKYPIEDEEEFKTLVKEAIKEWLNEQWATLGKWTAMGVLSAVLAALLTFILWAKGISSGH